MLGSVLTFAGVWKLQDVALASESGFRGLEVRIGWKVMENAGRIDFGM